MTKNDDLYFVLTWSGNHKFLGVLESIQLPWKYFCHSYGRNERPRKQRRKGSNLHQFARRGSNPQQFTHMLLC